jgi:hypothetical protein
MKVKAFPNKRMWPLFDYLEMTKGIKQVERYHPEKDVYTHLMQSLQIALKETNDTDLILASMLHDIGKAGEITAKYGEVIKSGEYKGHVEIGLEWLEGLVSAKTLWLIENHMRVGTFITGEMRRPGKITALVEHPWFPELVHLYRIDKKARDPHKEPVYMRKTIVKALNRKAGLHFYDPTC